MLQPPHHRVRERHGPLEPRLSDELDRIVDDRVHRLVGERELVGAEAERGEHRPVELPDGPLAEPVDPEVERAGALHGAVGEPLRERAVALVEPLDGRGERAVGVRLLLEDTAHDLERGAARGGDHLRPRRNSS